MSLQSEQLLKTVKKKSKNGIFKLLFSRFAIMFVLILLQLTFFLGLLTWFSRYFSQLYFLSNIFGLLFVVYIVNHHMNSTAKITWLVIIMAFPVFGCLLYTYVSSNLGHRILTRLTNKMIAISEDKLPENKEVLLQLENENPGLASLVKYIQSSCGNYPVYQHTQSKYFRSGEEKLPQLISELKNAKHFIFMEYFIIEQGEIWSQILDVLVEKVQSGVEVRLMFDGTNAFTKVPMDYDEQISKLGIKCKMFAPVSPFVSTHYNYRDHRKIVVIDGKVAITGGINLADEYMNINSPYGHWKDTAVIHYGAAVTSYTLMFLQLWNISEKVAHFDTYLLPQSTYETIENDGYVIPFGDEPLDSEKVGRNVYIDILNRATKYVHIMTPYLILDGETEHAICFAASRGVEVKLLLPGIPDKKVPYALAKTYYRNLLNAGVDIYEYDPGFIHAKVFISDDNTAVVGTINLDYRSLYHHFECASLMYKVAAIKDIEEDFQNTLKVSRLVLFDYLDKRPRIQKIGGWLVKLIAPFL